MLKQRARLIAATVFLLDLLLVSVAFVGAHLLRDELLPALGPALGLTGLQRGLYPLSTYLPLLPLALAIWSVLLWSSGRYRSHRTVPLLEEATAVVRVSSGAAIVFALAVWGFRLDERLLGSDRISRTWILLFAVLAGVLLLAEKLALRVTSRHVRMRGFNFRTVLIIGTNPAARAIAESVRAHRWWGYRILGFVSNEEGGEPADPAAQPLLGGLADLPRLLSSGQVVDEVIFSVSRKELDRFEDLFLALQEQGILTRFALNFFPHTQAKIRLEELDGVPLVTFATSPTGALELAFKRLLDVTLSALVLLLAAPVVLVVAMAIRLTGRAVLFRQTRCGLNGRQFTLYKFRTMVEDAEARRLEVAHLNEMNGPVFKARNDPRVTRVGRFLRRFSLDELPQLWNVLRGDMSLVGPRPPIPEEVAQYERWQRRRLAMKPGLTCLWQISGRNDLDFDQWMRLDLLYIDSWSPWLDLKILAKTLPVVLSGRGAS